MQDFIIQNYLWIKALHVISMVSWMAGLLYLPRLFAYHVEAGTDAKISATFQTMERKLIKIIMNPAMILTWIFGGLMLYGNTGLFSQGWIHVKLLFVVLLSVLHMVFGKWRKNLAAGKNVKSAKFYKVWNEVPAVFMIVIVIMAVAEPF